MHLIIFFKSLTLNYEGETVFIILHFTILKKTFLNKKQFKKSSIAVKIEGTYVHVMFCEKGNYTFQILHLV